MPKYATAKLYLIVIRQFIYICTELISYLTESPQLHHLSNYRTLKDLLERISKGNVVYKTLNIPHCLQLENGIHTF